MPFEVSLTLMVLAAVGSIVFRRGGPPERIAAAVILVWFLTDISYHLLFGPSGFVTVDPVHLVLDGVELAAILWLALRANRMWPMWAAGAQLICVAGHFAAYIEPGGMRRAYWAMTQIPPLMQVIALLLGAAFHARRLRRVGPYRSWRVA